MKDPITVVDTAFPIYSSSTHTVSPIEFSLHSRPSKPPGQYRCLYGKRARGQPPNMAGPVVFSRMYTCAHLNVQDMNLRNYEVVTSVGNTCGQVHSLSHQLGPFFAYLYVFELDRFDRISSLDQACSFILKVRFIAICIELLKPC